jgi:hypothetical protein
MANPVKKFFVKLLRKSVMALVVGFLTLTVYSLWLYVREPSSFTGRREALVAANEEELTGLRGELAELTNTKTETSAALTAQQARLEQAEKTLKTLHLLDPGLLDRLFGDAQEQNAHAGRIDRMDTIRGEAAKRVVELQKQLVLTEARLAEVGDRLPVLEQNQLTLAAEQQAVFHYLRMAWAESRWLVAAVVFAYLFGRFIVDLALFYGVAPGIVRGKAVQLVQGDVVLPTVQESSLSVADELWPGEVLRVRRNFLQFSEEGLKRRLCLVLNWRRAFSCLASGLTGLIELRNERNAGGRRVTFASSVDPFAELSIVSVPEGGSFILRAGFLVGVITSGGKSVAIRRHLRLFHWQSWVSGRFGYWEFFGPCRLIVSCVSAVSVEVMRAADESGEQPSRWVAQTGVVGFSPQLALKPVRCLSFWRYYTERRPLYEVEISGTGVFLASESGGQARQRMRGNEGPAVKLLKLFGL